MPRRKKRLRKGIESIRKQIDLHKAKLEEAKKAGNIGLVDYYEKELESLNLALARKQAFLKKRK